MLYMSKHTHMAPGEFKEFRHRLRLSQAALADELGCTANTVARWERGKTSIPKSVARLLRLLSEQTSTASAITPAGIISKDPHHTAILQALNRRIDPEAFEACAVDLLSKDWPRLVPVRGGSDRGYDGAIPTEEGSPWVLVTTTSSDARRNLQENLRQATKMSPRVTHALFATSRSLNPNTRHILFDTALAFDVMLVNVYDQDWFASALYRDPAWCKRLLNVSGRPSALSLIPQTRRPLLGDQVIGREEELQALRNLEHDCVVVGDPGSGKTFLLRALALEGRGLFLTDNNPQAIADAVRGQDPESIIVDDAHENPDLLTKLSHLRLQTQAVFKIIAATWRPEQEHISTELGIGQVEVVQMPLIDADTMVEVIKSAGLEGPNPLIASIVHQAGGRPGLAVTLAYLCLRGEARGVFDGEALAQHTIPVLRDLVGGEVTELLGAFSLAGDTGCPLEPIAHYFQKPLDEISGALSRLAAAGIIHYDIHRHISVWPKPLRYVLVKRVFFDGAAGYESLFQSLPNRDEALRSLLGAQARGAQISNLECLLEERQSPQMWKEYAWLGRFQVGYVLTKHPEFAIAIAGPALRHSPERILPFLLDDAVGDERPLNSAPDHPLRQVQDWMAQPPRPIDDAVQRREALVAATSRWWFAGEKTPDRARVGLGALVAAFAPDWRQTELDPGQGRSVTFSHGVVGTDVTDCIRALWASTASLVVELCEYHTWTEVLDLVRTWTYAPPSISLPEELLNKRLEFANELIRDVAAASRTHHPGVQHQLEPLRRRVGAPVELNTDVIFETLYPQEDRERPREQFPEWNEATRALATKWAKSAPGEIARTVAWAEREASCAGITYPRLTPRVCQELVQLVSHPAQWAVEFVQAEVPADLLEPLLDKAMRDGDGAATALCERCLEVPAYRGAAVSVLITVPTPPPDLLAQAIRESGRFAQLIETNCLRGLVPAETLELLLTADDDRVAIAAAIGCWNDRSSQGEKLPFLADWRQAVLRTAQTEHIAEVDDYWVTEILKSDSTLAQDWLLECLQHSDSFIEYRRLEVVETAVTSLDNQQKKKVLKSLKPERAARFIVRKLTRNDTTLYEELLRLEELSKYHLQALEGPPDASWAECAVMALDAGYSIDDVLEATLPTMWSWSGPESGLWTQWQQAFEAYAQNTHPRLAEVARQGTELMEKKVKQCLEIEKRRSVHPL